jgi:Ca2+-binding RTX toxin-like protein
MATRTINGNSLGNTIDVSDYNAIPGTGYTVSGQSSMTPAGLAPFFETDVVINTLNATLGTDFVNLSLLTTNSGVSFTSITINGGGGSQIVTGSGFAETISTFAGNDTINSGAGDDTLTGGDGADSMDGGEGSDLYNIAGGQLGGDTFNDTGIIGTDTINVTGALSTFLSFGKFGTNYNGINTNLPFSALATYQGIEIFDGNNFSISGVNNGSDIFDLSGFSSATQVGAINTFDATLGTDYVNVSTADAGVTITGGGGSQIVVGSGYADTISTGSGNDTINAGAGNDTITGGLGADSMNGGDGDDLYNIAGGQLGGDTFNDTGTIIGSDTINVTGALSTFLSFGKFGTVYSSINPLLPASALATYQGIEFFDGNNFAISGVNNGSDIFDLSGFSSATQVGAINTFDATGGTDYVNVSTADAGVTITGGGGSQIVVGSGYADTISTGGGNDSITGGAGHDSLFGGAGDDTFFANLNEAEFDELHGGLGVDTLQRATTGGQSELVLNQFLATNGIERVDLGTAFGIDGNGNDNVLDFSATTFFSSRNVEGGGGNDTIIATNSATSTYDGNSGDDVLNGGSVADNLIGSNGNDTLTGGGGNDCFYFNTALNAFTNLDTITDFKKEGDADIIYLSNTIFTGLAAGMLQSPNFGYVENEGTDVVYSGGGLYFKDGGAANLGDYTQFATLTGSPTVYYTDIFVFEP